MAIFNNTMFAPVVEQDEDMIVDQYPHIQPTVESAYEIAYESYSDMYKLLGGLYVADVMIEQAVIEGADGAALMENAATDFVKKAVAKLKELKNKIVAWFKKILDNIKVRFTASSKFVQTYEKQLKAKAKTVTGYKPMMHKIDEDVEKIVGEAIGKVVAFANKEKGKVDGEKAKATEDFGSKLIKAVDGKATDFNGLKKNLSEKIISADKVETLVTEAKVNAMIEYCKNTSKALKAIEDVKAKNVKTIDEAIGYLNGLNKEVDVAHAFIANFNKAISLVQQLNTVAVSAVNAINAEYVAVLRGLMVRKVKESAEEELMEEAEPTTENSIFESALAMI